MPTIWVGQSYIEMLPLYEASPLIGEVIIIDNDITNTDDDIFKYSKVVHVPQTENIYVNPAWNLGAKLAKHDILCFANDDISIDLRFLHKAIQYVTPENGLLGLGEDSIRDANSINEFANNDEDPIITSSDKINARYANFFLTHKDSYYQIPETLKVHYGDVYLYDRNEETKKMNYELKNGFAVTILGTSSKFFKDVTRKDRELYPIIKGDK